MEDALFALVLFAISRYVAKNNFSYQVTTEILNKIGEVIAQPADWSDVGSQAAAKATEASTDPGIQEAVMRLLVTLHSS